MVKIDPNDRSELLQRYAQDVLRDPLLRFLDSNLNWLIVIASSWVAFFMISWSAALAMGSSMADALQFGASVLVWAVVVRTVFVFEMTMCVNSVTHFWGYRTYQTSDYSKTIFGLAY